MALKLQSIQNPNILLGYQIIIPYDNNESSISNIESLSSSLSSSKNNDNNVYVIIDTAKNNLRKTEFKIINLTEKDPIWVRLKRGRKLGIEFRLMRHVIDI
jgi:hypothetical protein